mmetsp:Transcript_39856/g.68768  ORF Transcript_39856/g.68768 Transcript_39856/m.68768 type:complete len:81 (+) Transcript_39856:710-952(+)
MTMCNLLWKIERPMGPHLKLNQQCKKLNHGGRPGKKDNRSTTLGGWIQQPEPRAQLFNYSSTVLCGVGFINKKTASIISE